MVGDNLVDLAVRSRQRQRHRIQLRVAVAPREDLLKAKGLAAQILVLRGQLQPAVKQRALLRVGDAAMDRPLPLQQQTNGQGPGGVVRFQPRLEPQVGQVDGGLSVEEHGAEDTREPEEVLVLNPGGAGPLVHLHAQPVALFPEVGGQIEVGGGKAVLSVTDELSVEPEIEGLLHPLEADTDLLSQQSLI